MRDLFADADPQRESLYIGTLALLLFTVGIWTQPFVEFDSRFALFAQEMWRHGPSWFPTTYGAPYADYPATSTLLIWLVSQPFGAVTKLSAVLPSAFAAALNLAISYRLVARFSRQWALATVCFELLTVTFLDEARSISLDQLVATVTLLSFYLAYTATRQPLTLFLGLAALLIIGFAIRGPLGVVMPAGVVCSYYLLSAQWRRLLSFGLIAGAILLLCWFGLLGLANHFYGTEFARDVIHMQVAGRMDSGKTAPWYYFTSSFGNYALSYPIAVLMVALLTWTKPSWWRKEIRSERESFLLYMIGWILIVMAGL
ncbi:MAG TPA: hypothetical protein VLC91_02500, partial [Spongiibacteraceae bacterium]|nr:hypothetical protein [Spongiibacteraceae bacterium]